MAIRWLLVGVASRALASIPSGLQEALQAIAGEESRKYNCSVSIAVRGADWAASAAAGTTDFASGRQALPSDAYVWGSGTKPLTGASILKLVSEGAFGLDDPVPPLVDPILSKMASADPSQNFTSMAELWGEENVTKVTVRQLLAMQAGIPDFDTAKPSPGGDKDPLRAFLYANPQKAYTPTELMGVPWVTGRFSPCTPEMFLCYSSTNFMLLGLILANHAGDDAWRQLRQGSFVPPSLRAKLRFAVSGAPRNHTPVRGYDRTAYNLPAGQHNDQDVSGVDGVFAGWTASDLVATTPAAAELAWEIYGPQPEVLPPTHAALMVPEKDSIYGLATFNLGFRTGQNGTYGVAYGHLGATYGYQSVLAYFPALRFSMAIATNVETDNQAQPADAMCLAYNAAAGALLGQQIHCAFEAAGYYGGLCKCNAIEAPREVVLV